MPPFRLVAIALGLLGALWLTDPAVAKEGGGLEHVSVQTLTQATPESPAQMLDQLATANVVYLGEIHDRPADHAAQLTIIQALHQRQPRLIVGLEMVQRPFQAALDDYLAGKLSEADLQTRTEYAQRWGFPWEFYAPILRFAQAQGLRGLALNAPREVTRKVARQGLESLTWAERRFIPPVSAIEVGPESYRQRLQALFAGMHGKSGRSFERFFQAQVLWDETMAEQVAEAVRRYPDHAIVVLAGQGHVVYGEGIPQRVARRLQQQRRPLRQYTVLLNPDAELRNPATNPPATNAIADYFWTQPNRAE
jgi:uncharacterized iron-regulated protein